MSLAVLRGSLSHARLSPPLHRFRYPISLLELDLEQAADQLRPYWLWSMNRPNLGCILRKDHLRGGDADLATAVRDRVEGETGRRPQGRVILITQPRCWGLGFNPISLYLCHDAAERLQAVIAEVHNTPWGEQIAYVLPVSEPEQQPLRLDFAKAMHVSPFQPMDLSYSLELERGEDRMHIALDCSRAGERVFAARLRLDRNPASSRNLARMLLGRALKPAAVLAAIHFEALRLWFKRARYYPHPGTPPARASAPPTSS